MPIGDTPALQLIIDEALGAGIDHIVIVSSRSKPAIERLLRAIARCRGQARGRRQDRTRRPDPQHRDATGGSTIVYQDDPRGLGHAVGCAREAVGDEPFAVLLPDELMGDSSLLAQMNGVCVSTGGSVVGAQAGAARRGQLATASSTRPATIDDRRRDRRRATWSRSRPSRMHRATCILIGRYVLTPDVFDEIAAAEAGQRWRVPAHRRAAGPGGPGAVPRRAVARSPATTPAPRSASSRRRSRSRSPTPTSAPPCGASSPTCLLTRSRAASDADSPVASGHAAAEVVGEVERRGRTRRRRSRPRCRSPGRTPATGDRRRRW